MHNLLLGLGLHLGAGFLRLIAEGLDLACKAITHQFFC